MQTFVSHDKIRRNRRIAFVRSAVVTATMLVLSACAQPWTAFRPGDAATALTARLGAPAEHMTCPTAVSG